MAALASPYYETSDSWTTTASSGGYCHDRLLLMREREASSKAEIARVVTRDKRERKARRDRLVIGDLARQQGLQAQSALRDRQYRRWKRRVPDRLAQRCRRVFR